LTQTHFLLFCSLLEAHIRWLLIQNVKKVKNRPTLPIIHFYIAGLFGSFRFWFVSVCFETNLFVSVVSKRVRNTETNRKNNLLVSRNKPKINRNRLCFGLFRFEPKKRFVCFEDTLEDDEILQYFGSRCHIFLSHYVVELFWKLYIPR
jgi:hypothetical protein